MKLISKIEMFYPTVSSNESPNYRSNMTNNFDMRLLCQIRHALDISKDFSFSHLLTGENSKSKGLKEETYQMSILIFKSIVSIKTVFLKSNNELLKSQRNSLKINCKEKSTSAISNLDGTSEKIDEKKDPKSCFFIDLKMR